MISLAAALVGGWVRLGAPAAAAPPSTVVDDARAAQAKAANPQAIRAVEVKSLMASALGWAAVEEVAYADLTGDGKEEVIVPMTTGGSAGDRAVAVYGYDPEGFLRPLLVRQSKVGHLLAKVEMGHLVIEEPLYGPNDPNCCPSQMTFTRYAWDGHALIESNRRTEKAKK
jgi:hypothetical protein